MIHGKGLGSREGLPVLKQVIRTWLRHHPHVLAFCEADDAQGGAYATGVLARREQAFERGGAIRVEHHAPHHVVRGRHHLDQAAALRSRLAEIASARPELRAAK